MADVFSPAIFRGAGTMVGYPKVRLQSGIHFNGQQQNKGNSYKVDVFIQVRPAVIDCFMESQLIRMNYGAPMWINNINNMVYQYNMVLCGWLCGCVVFVDATQIAYS